MKICDQTAKEWADSWRTKPDDPKLLASSKVVIDREELAQAASMMELLLVLVNAVDVSHSQPFRDVDGFNWFDVRDSINDGS